MENKIVEQITGIDFIKEYETNIDKYNYGKIKKWLEYQLFKAKKCIQKTEHVCEVHFEPDIFSNTREMFFISICRLENELTFTLKKRVLLYEDVSERFSKITKEQFCDFVEGNFDNIDSSVDDLVFEFCQKAKIEQLKAVYTFSFEREAYIFKKSNVLLTIDKELGAMAIKGGETVFPPENTYRLRIKNTGIKKEKEFEFVKDRLLSVL